MFVLSPPSQQTETQRDTSFLLGIRFRTIALRKAPDLDIDVLGSEGRHNGDIIDAHACLPSRCIYNRQCSNPLTNTFLHPFLPLNLTQSNDIIMGNSISRAQYMALGSFGVNFGTQIYGMLVKPNMKDIADAVRRSLILYQRPLKEFAEPLCFLTQPMVHCWLFLVPGCAAGDLDQATVRIEGRWISGHREHWRN